MFPRSLSLVSASFLLLSSTAVAQLQFREARSFVAPDHKKALYNCRTGDVDRDGFTDLLYACDYSGVVIYRNDGAGGFTDETAKRLPPATNYATYDVAARDMDGDGDLDLVVANDHIYANRILINDGTGKFSDASAARFPANGHWTTGLAVFDVDGDKDLDIWFHNSQNQPDHLFLNNGKGFFSMAPQGSVPVIKARYKPHMETGDLDGDGDLDLLIEGYPIQILINNGKGRFAHSTTLKFQIGEISYPRIRDFNGDSRNDVWFANGHRLYFGLAAGGFQDVTMTHLPVSRTRGPEGVADVDLDGDLDLVGNYQVYLNDGKGKFSNATQARLSSASRFGNYTVLADLDGDRDPDILCPSWRSIMVNHDAQLAAAASPTLGKNFRLEFDSQPGYATGPRAVLPLLSLGETRIPLGIFGDLRLNPSTMFTLPARSMGTQTGRTTLDLQIPAQASWRGVDLFFQAATIRGAARVTLGNLLRERIR